MQAERRAFYAPERILNDVQDKVNKAGQADETIDYLTFVPDGEPTQDANLGRWIELLRPLGIKIAVITNSSLLWRKDVQEDLMNADWVSLKIDSTRPEIWRRIDRPYGTLRLASILDGMIEFASSYEGELVTETMLVADINDSETLIAEVADFVALLHPATSYLSVATRPPAEEWVRTPCEDAVNRAYQILSERVDRVEYLIGYEGNAFAFTGNVEEDLLAITAVHPMREDAVSEFLVRAGAAWPVVQGLVDQGQLVEIDHEGTVFYLRKLWLCPFPS
jgi:wyosine [tRNA(Phe)-imidazoG37] synthetase (radical SAM superfamily)